LKTCINADPAVVDSTSLSLKLRRNCTAGETSEPNVAVAITHLGGVQGPVAVDTVVVVDTTEDVVWTVVVVIVVLVVVGVVVAVVVLVVVSPALNKAVAESPRPAFV